MTSREWIEWHVERYATGLCRDLWHDSGHGFHSSCPSCGGKFMRGHAVDRERERLTGFVREAERYAIATGWERT